MRSASVSLFDHYGIERPVSFQILSAGPTMKKKLNISRSAIGVSRFVKFTAALAAAIACAVTLSSSLRAQTADNASVTANANPRVPSRVTQAIDEKQLTRLAGNVHPLAAARFDQGAVADSQPMN